MSDQTTSQSNHSIIESEKTNPLEITVVDTPTQPPRLNVVNEDCDEGNNDEAEPTTAFFNENSSDNQIPVPKNVLSADEVVGNNKAIINLQKQIEEHNKVLLGENNLKTDITLIQSPHDSGNILGSVVTPSTIHESKICSFESEPKNLLQEITTICGVDDAASGLVDEDSQSTVVAAEDVMDPSLKISSMKNVKRSEMSHSVSTRSVIDLKQYF